jgi:uncharacterized ParB-like nuclease family protein
LDMNVQKGQQIVFCGMSGVHRLQALDEAVKAGNKILVFDPERDYMAGSEGGG